MGRDVRAGSAACCVLLLELQHLCGQPCQLALPSGMFKEAYCNLTRNLSSSVNLWSPHLPSTCSYLIHLDSALLPAATHPCWFAALLLLGVCCFAHCCCLLSNVVFAECMSVCVYMCVCIEREICIYLGIYVYSYLCRYNLCIYADI